MINNILYIYTYILLRSIYQILNILFYFGHYFFYIIPDMGKFWTDPVAIFVTSCI